MAQRTMNAPLDLAPLIRPRSIAIVGASMDPHRVGGRPLDYLRRWEAPVTLYPINPKHDLLGDLPCYPDLASLPATPDLAILAVSASQTLAQAQAAVDRGVPALLSFAGGFAETGEAQGLGHQRALADVVTGRTILCGPNCAGLINFVDRIPATFTTAIDEEPAAPPAGRVAFITQSGAFGTYGLALMGDRGLRLSHWINTGNEVGAQVGDCIDFAARDPSTKVIVAYIESVKDGSTFLASLRTAQEQDKPVVVCKVGRSRAGARAARSHTDAIVGSDDVYEGLFRQENVIRVTDLHEALDIARAFGTSTPPRSERTAIVTISGGAGVLMADEASRVDLELPAPSSALRDHLRSILPYGGVTNPFDVTGQVVNQPDLYAEYVHTILSDPTYDSVIIFLAHTAAVGEIGEALRQRTLNVLANSDKLVCLSMLDRDASWIATLQERGVACFENPATAVRMVAALNRHRQRTLTLGPVPSFTDADVPWSHVADPTEYRTKQFLQSAGLTVPRGVHVSDADEAAAATAELGRSVVVKVSSPDVIHKAAAGGLVLGVTTPEAARTAFTRVVERVRDAHPDARIEGALIEEHLPPGGVEFIVACRGDPVFGAVIVFGRGGSLVELDAQVSTHVLAGRGDVADLLSNPGVAPLFDEDRDAPLDRDAAANALRRLATFAPLLVESGAQLEINPLVVYPLGQGAVAVDAVLLNGAHPDGTRSNTTWTH